MKAYVKRNKNDAADAEAICEAVRRPTMRFVQIKSAEQQGQLMQHRTRDLLMRQRTQLINALRAHLAELGIVAAKASVSLMYFSPRQFLSRKATAGERSSIDEHDIERADDRRDIGKHVPAAQEVHRLKMGE